MTWSEPLHFLVLLPQWRLHMLWMTNMQHPFQRLSSPIERLEWSVSHKLCSFTSNNWFRFPPGWPWLSSTLICDMKPQQFHWVGCFRSWMEVKGRRERWFDSPLNPTRYRSPAPIDQRSNWYCLTSYPSSGSTSPPINSGTTTWIFFSTSVSVSTYIS